MDSPDHVVSKGSLDRKEKTAFASKVFPVRPVRLVRRVSQVPLAQLVRPARLERTGERARQDRQDLWDSTARRVPKVHLGQTD